MGGIPKSAFDELCVSLEQTYGENPQVAWANKTSTGLRAKSYPAPRTAREEVAATVRSKSYNPKSRAKGRWKKLKNAIDGGEYSPRSSSLKAGLPSRKIAPASELESDGSDPQVAWANKTSMGLRAKSYPAPRTAREEVAATVRSKSYNPKSRAKGRWKKLKNAIDGGEYSPRSSSLKAGLPSRKIAPASELESDGSDDQQQQPSERKLHSRSYRSLPDGSSKPSKMLRSKSLKLGRSGARLTDKAEDGPCMHLLVGSFPVHIVPVPP